MKSFLTINLQLQDLGWYMSKKGTPWKHFIERVLFFLKLCRLAAYLKFTGSKEIC